jgi:membrane protein DedA with SNARE-associated domain
MRIKYTHFLAGVALSAVIFDGSLIILGLITKYGFQFIGFEPSVIHVAVGLIIVMSIVMVIMTLRARRRSTGENSQDEEISVNGTGK